ncbi:vascular endothelial growth factor receptor 2-like [Copidosoma floridanum]|uniref:vascular endothelial growth factor receptor 2-like n=1 Tax=Copidosoma floridanum TaxID=29053 RepID=UPI000C6FBE84|nr:vascular endothelial growth factor receptor 2-like [Copidosoma floridanum]
MDEQSHSAEYKSTVMLRPEAKSTIKCMGCNSYGCNDARYDIHVTDGIPNEAYGVIKPKINFHEGQNISLVCSAVIREFSQAVWYDDKNNKVEDSERIKVTFEETNFTHRAIISINNVNRLDERDYYCTANNEFHKEIPKKYSLQLNAYFVHGNINNVAITRFAKDPENPVYLSCHFEGIPTPNIMWFKNSTSISSSKQFSLEDRNQKLIIRYLLKRDSGDYLCVAENGFWPFKEKQLVEAGHTHFKEGAVDLINPELTIDEQAELLPYDIRWEFPIEKLRLDKQLGSGAFGVVYKAEAYRILPYESITTVAVKTVRRNADLMYISALAKELKTMVYLGQHSNVVNLLGACTKNIAKRELLVIIVLCRCGNLESYLVRHRKNFINQIDPSTGQIDTSMRKNLKRTRHEIYENLTTALSDSSLNDNHTIHYSEIQNSSGSIESSDYIEEDFLFICTEDLMLWAYQVANGMKFLSERKVLHCDLAARNILLAENNIVKICDFGLAKTLYKDENYKKQCDGKLPIRWMAIESIRDGVFSTMSDVWSFGVVLWEFFSLAEIPYLGVGFEVMYQKIIRGYRMAQPTYATDDM